KYQRPMPRMFLPDPPQGLHSRFRLGGFCQPLRIKFLVSPGNLLVVDLVFDAEVVERNQPLQLDAAANVGAIRNEVVEEPMNVRGVSAIWSRGQPEKKLRIDRIKDS